MGDSALGCALSFLTKAIAALAIALWELLYISRRKTVAIQRNMIKVIKIDNARSSDRQS
jgi:hypothetical protein